MIKRTLGSRRDDLYDPDAARREILFIVQRFGLTRLQMFACDNGMSFVYLLYLFYLLNYPERTERISRIMFKIFYKQFSPPLLELKT